MVAWLQEVVLVNFLQYLLLPGFPGRVWPRLLLSYHGSDWRVQWWKCYNLLRL
jgi:hypothetical protein